MKTTEYFRFVRSRPGRGLILDEWIQDAVEHPAYEEVQDDGRIKRWAAIAEFGGRWLRVVLLEDGETVHNAFFDRRFRR